MSTMSLVFFGLMFIPLIIFLIWLIRKDRNRNYLGLLVLVIMTVIAIMTIVKYDMAFLESRSTMPAKTQAPSYR